VNAGIHSFVDAMSAAGRQVDVREPIVLVLVDVPLGIHAGAEVWVGADPPQDFPTVPPHWLHLPQTIDLADGGKQASELGPDWAKWSRPHKRWTDGPRPEIQWLAHARAVLAQAVT
jgi:hypothetical protein